MMTKTHALVIRDCDAAYGRVETVTKTLVVVNHGVLGSALMTPAEFTRNYIIAAK